MAERDAWDRVSTILDQMVGERVRLNQDRKRALEADHSSGAEQFIPTSREVNQALQQRDGHGMSFRDLGPLVQRYVHEYGVLQLLRPRPSQRYEELPDAASEDLPKQIRLGIDRVFGTFDAQREKLAGLLANHVAAKTEQFQAAVRDLTLEVLELRRQLASQDDIIDDADQARKGEAAAISAREQETAWRLAAESEAAEAQARAGVSERERASATEAVRVATEAYQASQVRCDELMAHATRLSGELERAGREREDHQRQISELAEALSRVARRSEKGRRSRGGAGGKTKVTERSASP